MPCEPSRTRRPNVAFGANAPAVVCAAMRRAVDSRSYVRCIHNSRPYYAIWILSCQQEFGWRPGAEAKRRRRNVVSAANPTRRPRRLRIVVRRPRRLHSRSPHCKEAVFGVRRLDAALPYAGIAVGKGLLRMSRGLGFRDGGQRGHVILRRVRWKKIRLATPITSRLNPLGSGTGSLENEIASRKFRSLPWVPAIVNSSS